MNQKTKPPMKQHGAGGVERRQRLGISIYRRVASVLRRRISTGEWQPGDRLPALDALVAEFQVGRVTVRHIHEDGIRGA